MCRVILPVVRKKKEKASRGFVPWDVIWDKRNKEVKKKLGSRSTAKETMVRAGCLWSSPLSVIIGNDVGGTSSTFHTRSVAGIDEEVLGNPAFSR